VHLVQMTTTTTAPWWYVATLAGGFTILGTLLSFLTSWITSRRKNILDDFRRFEPDIVATYVQFDEFAEILHNNAGGDPKEESATYWRIYQDVVAMTTKLELIASEAVYKAARKFMKATQKGPDDYDMPGIVQSLEELRRVIRHELRIDQRSWRTPRATFRGRREEWFNRYIINDEPQKLKWIHPWRTLTIWRAIKQDKIPTERVRRRYMLAFLKRRRSRGFLDEPPF